MNELHPYHLVEEKLPDYNIHPGINLQDELKASNLTQKALTNLIGLKPSMLNVLIKWKRSITPQIALILEAGLGISTEFWLKGQQVYDLYKASAAHCQYSGKARKV